MHLQVAGAHGDGEHAEALAAQLEARTGRPQAVTHGHLHAVQGGQARHLVATGHLQGKIIHVIGRVSQDLALARGAAGGMDAHHFLFGHAEQGQGIAFAQVFHVHGGQTAQIVQRGDVVRRDATGFQTFAVLGGLESLAHGEAQAFQLLAGDLFGRKPGDETVSHGTVSLRSWTVATGATGGRRDTSPQGGIRLCRSGKRRIPFRPGTADAPATVCRPSLCAFLSQWATGREQAWGKGAHALWGAPMKMAPRPSASQHHSPAGRGATGSRPSSSIPAGLTEAR
mgnify:CR=1 FL=1